MKTLEITYLALQKLTAAVVSDGEMGELCRLPAGSRVVAMRWTATGLAVDYVEAA